MGIDPGQRGGVAIICDGLTYGLAGGLQVVYPLGDLRQLAIDLATYPVGHIALEKAQTMPRQGIKGAFTYGVGFGRLLQLLESSKVPHTLVPPSIWAKALHIGTKGPTAKAKSLQACRRLFPHAELIPPGCRVPHDGIVDALLLAEYARRLHGGKL